MRIKVRLAEEEKEKLERNSILCGLTQSESMSASYAGAFTRNQNPGCVLEADGRTIQGSFRPERMCQIRAVRPELCAEIERLVLNLQEAI